jgi:hypothetical protein
MNSITRLQDWFVNQCNDAWEHEGGITIETIDNPGWHVRIDLGGTTLAGGTLDAVEESKAENDWYLCRVTEAAFEGFGGPRNLDDIVNVFLTWSSANAPT